MKDIIVWVIYLTTEQLHVAQIMIHMRAKFKIIQRNQHPGITRLASCYGIFIKKQRQPNHAHKYIENMTMIWPKTNRHFYCIKMYTQTRFVISNSSKQNNKNHIHALDNHLILEIQLDKRLSVQQNDFYTQNYSVFYRYVSHFSIRSMSWLIDLVVSVEKDNLVQDQGRDFNLQQELVMLYEIPFIKLGDLVFTGNRIKCLRKCAYAFRCLLFIKDLIKEKKEHCFHQKQSFLELLGFFIISALIFYLLLTDA